jgi:hypothetical protein
MREMGVGAGEAVVRLVETDKSGCILQFGSEEDLIKILQHPKSRGPLVLGHYVRELKVMTCQDAVRKMTLLPDRSTVGTTNDG